MCQSKISQIIPQYNKTTGEFEGVIIHASTDVGITGIKATDIEGISSSVNEDNELVIIANLVTDLSFPKVTAVNPVIHTFNISKSQLQNITGFNDKTVIKITYNFDGNPVNYWDWYYYDCYIDYINGVVKCKKLLYWYKD